MIFTVTILNYPPSPIHTPARYESSFASETFYCSVSKREVRPLPDNRLDQFMRCYILSFVDEIFG